MFHLLELENCPIIEQLRIEEALLRGTTLNWCITNYGAPKALVMGISGKRELLIDEGHLAKHPIPLVRRFTGGGTVVIDENTAFMTIIANSNDLNVASFPQEVAKWNSQLYADILPHFALQENDYVIGDKKFGGNAQYLQKGRWLHHSSLLWDYSNEMMSYLLLPQKRPIYRKNRDHEKFLCSLKSHFLSPLHLLKTLLQELKKKATLQRAQQSVVQEALLSSHRHSSLLLEL